MATVDLSGLMNPKRVIQRREDESDDEFAKRKRAADEEEAAKAKASTVLTPDGVGSVQFTKSFTKEERAEQMRKRDEMLRKRK